MALVSAVATLFAALFICLGSGTDPAGPGDHHRTGSFTAASQAEARYNCPYDGNDCGFVPHLSPAVLTVPPPAAPLLAGVPHPRLELPSPHGRLPRPEALARALDLHVLQVLRT